MSLIRLQGNNIASKRRYHLAAQRQAPPWKISTKCCTEQIHISLSAFMRRTLGMSVVTLGTVAKATPLSAIYLLIASFDALSTTNDVDYCRVYLGKDQEPLRCTFILKKKRHIFTCLRKKNFKQLPTRLDCVTKRLGQKQFHSWNRPYQKNTFQETKVFASLPREALSSPQPRASLVAFSSSDLGTLSPKLRSALLATT